MVYPGFMKNKTNECHNKCYTGCHGDDISDQEGGRFYPETRVKTPAKISPLKGPKFSFISTMTTKLYLHIIEETCIAQNHTFISKFFQVLLRYLTKT